MVWDAGRRFQVRLRVTVTLSDDTDRIWHDLGPGARRNYARSPTPGSEIPAPGAIEPIPDPRAFVVLTAQVNEIETLWLADDVHRRALFTKERACWLAP